MFCCNNTIYHLIHPNLEIEYRELEKYDIRRSGGDRTVFSYRTVGFDQRAYTDEIIKSLGQVFVDLGERLRSNGFFIAWENANNHRIDVWGARVVWIPIANSSGSTYLSSDQLEKLYSILGVCKMLANKSINGWTWRIKENLKPTLETGEGRKMCLFINTESHQTMENGNPWDSDPIFPSFDRDLSKVKHKILESNCDYIS